MDPMTTAPYVFSLHGTKKDLTYKTVNIDNRRDCDSEDKKHMVLGGITEQGIRITGR